MIPYDSPARKQVRLRLAFAALDDANVLLGDIGLVAREIVDKTPIGEPCWRCAATGDYAKGPQRRNANIRSASTG